MTEATRSENLGVPVLFGGNLPPMVEIGLIDLPKSEGAMAPPSPQETTLLHYYVPSQIFRPCDGPADVQIGAGQQLVRQI